MLHCHGELEHGKKGREGLFFNHHQLGLATKEVTRLAAVVVVVRGSFPSPLLYGPSTHPLVYYSLHARTQNKVHENAGGLNSMIAIKWQTHQLLSSVSFFNILVYNFFSK